MPNQSTINSTSYLNGPETFITGSGVIIEIEQQVLFQITGEGALIEIEQEVVVTASDLKIVVCQTVIAP